jgi:hypothetical protein
LILGILTAAGARMLAARLPRPAWMTTGAPTPVVEPTATARGSR